MKRVLTALAISLALCAVARAQTVQSVVVSSCGTPPVTYTAGQPYPQTQDTTGKLCTASTATATNPSVSTTGAAVPGSATYIGANKSGNLVAPTLDGSSNLNVNCQTGCAGASDNTATGTVTAVNNAVTASTTGNGSATAVVTANTNVTLIFEGTADGTNWVTVNAYPIGGGAAITSTTSGGTGTWSVPVGGFNKVRLRVTVAGATPTATVSINAGAGSTQTAIVASPTAANFNDTSNLAQINGSTVDTAAPGLQENAVEGNTGVPLDSAAGTPNAQAVTIQGNASGVAVPISGTVTTTPPANQSVNVAQVAGTTTDTNSGNKSAGTQRVVLATDQPALTNALKVDGSAVTQPVSGTVTANAGTNLNTSALATSANQPSNLAQEATTSGATANEVFGCATTSAPTYTTAKSDCLSLTTAGALRTDASASTQPVSGTVTANAGTNLNTSALALETGGNLATLAGAVTSSVVQSNTKQVNGVTTSTGTGAVGTGSQRVAVGTDTATIAGSAPGTAGSASAQVVTVQGVASMTKLLVTPDSVALPANQSVNVAQVNGVTTLTGTGAQGTGAQRVTVATDSATVAGSASLPTGTNTIGAAQPIGVSTGGISVFTKQVANNTTSFAVDASAGTLYGLAVYNNSGTIAYLKLYNTAQGSVTCGTPTPVDRHMIPANTNGAGAIIPFPVGIAYGTAITACVTTGFADNDTTAPAASTYIVDFYYK